MSAAAAAVAAAAVAELPWLAALRFRSSSPDPQIFPHTNAPSGRSAFTGGLFSEIIATDSSWTRVARGSAVGDMFVQAPKLQGGD